LVTEWPASAKARLERVLRSQAIVVRVSGCDLEVLEGCKIDAPYEFTKTTRSTDTIAIENEDDLFAKLPLGAFGLETELKRTGRLAVRTTVVGQFKLADADFDKAEGDDCSRATHVVEAVSVGAFTLFSGGSVRGGGSVGLAGGGASRNEQVVRQAGVEELCAATGEKPDPQCSSPIQVFLRDFRPPRSRRDTATLPVVGPTTTTPTPLPALLAAPWSEDFQRFSVGDPLSSWGQNLVVVQGRDGKKFMSSQQPGQHRASKRVPMGTSFVFGFTWTAFDHRQSGPVPPWVRIPIGLRDSSGKRFEFAHGNWGLLLPGRPNVDFVEGGVNRFRMERRGDTFKFFHNEKFLASAQFPGYGPFVGFDLVVPVTPDGRAQSFTDFSVDPIP
jgi:hypothetical protein